MSNQRERYALGVRLLWEIFPDTFVRRFFDEWTVEVHGQSKRLTDFQDIFQKHLTSKVGNKHLILYDSDDIESQKGVVQIDIFQLYFDWLSGMIFEWLDKNEIQYYYINIEGGLLLKHS